MPYFKSPETFIQKIPAKQEKITKTGTKQFSISQLTLSLRLIFLFQPLYKEAGPRLRRDVKEPPELLIHKSQIYSIL